MSNYVNEDILELKEFYRNEFEKLRKEVRKKINEKNVLLDNEEEDLVSLLHHKVNKLEELCVSFDFRITVQSSDILSDCKQLIRENDRKLSKQIRSIKKDLIRVEVSCDQLRGDYLELVKKLKEVGVLPVMNLSRAG